MDRRTVYRLYSIYKSDDIHPLETAIYNNNKDLINKLILEDKNLLNICCYDNTTPLGFAISKHNPDLSIVELLLILGASPIFLHHKIKNLYLNIYDTELPKDQLLDLLIQYGLDIDSTSIFMNCDMRISNESYFTENFRVTALHTAGYFLDTVMFKLLLDKGAKFCEPILYIKNDQLTTMPLDTFIKHAPEYFSISGFFKAGVIFGYLEIAHNDRMKSSSLFEMLYDNIFYKI